jgi:2,4-dienoyl-CoA reductase-like NADH-dependent reductase (Old Yellow Enzyme family)
MDAKYNPFFEPLTFPSGISLKHRIIMAPMTTQSADPHDNVSDAELQWYARRAKEVSMVVTACTYVIPNGKGFPREFGAESDERMPSLRRLAATIKEQGAKAVLQIFHGGRLCPPEQVPDGDVVAPSDIPIPGPEQPQTPRALREDEIETIVKAFGETTRRAIEAGFDGVEIHGANRYLIQQFFSPHSNRRTDRWGGNVEQRLTFPLAVVDTVKRAVAAHAKGPFLVGYRFSPEELWDPGITVTDTMVLVDALLEKELDYLHVSLFTFFAKPRTAPHGDRPIIDLIRERVGGRVPVIGVGQLYTADDALKARNTGTELIALGRPLIMEPDWVEKVQQERAAEIRVALNPADRDQLAIPDPMWEMIEAAPGWVPMVDRGKG